MRRLTDLVSAAAPNDDVRLGFLELSEPPASRVIAEMLAEGIDDIVVVPLMLHAAGHSKSDVPAVVLEARAAHP